MSFPQAPVDSEQRYLAACFQYLRFVFNGAPRDYIRDAAREIYRWSPYPWPPKNKDTVH
jgi:hypothetical protein